MSSRQGHNPHRNRSRDPQAPEGFPALPAPRIPPLRNLVSSRDRDRDRESTSAAPPPSSSTSTSTSHRPQTRHQSAHARRVERIRSLGERVPSLDDVESPLDYAWSSSRRLDQPRLLPPYFGDIDRPLHEANSRLRALLDVTTNSNITASPMPPPYSPPPRPHDFPDDNRRSKRRKLDSDKAGSTARGFRYGKYGQVETGQLRMEMVSCDGGMFSNESVYAAENILKDDSSVYCTKGNRCNIVLRHQGSTLFTLEELVIKAPGSMNYSHPVREGMVFISMNQDDALSRTAQYQIQYVPRSRDDPCLGHGDDRHLYIPDTRHIISIRPRDDGTTSTRARRSFVYRDEEDDDDDYRTAQMPDEFVANVPDLRITTECSDDEEDDCDGLRSFLRRTPNRIGSLPFETHESDSDEHNPFGSEDLVGDMPRRHRDHDRIRRDRSRSDLSLAEAWEAHANATQEAIRAVGGELLVPHARFFIEKKKSKCTIRFDPPVTGRFILLKMWSSQHDPGSNIDIQSVMARGFAGPRYFPSVELR